MSRNEQITDAHETSSPFAKLDELVASDERFNSYTLFVRDPITDELRLEWMNGIDHPEPLNGFFLPSEEESRLVDEANGRMDERSYFADPEEAHLVAPIARNSRTRDVCRRLEEQGMKAFAPFSVRERIKSCLRLQFPAGKPTIVLFANFSEPLDVVRASDLDDIISQAFAEIVGEEKSLASQLDHEYQKAYAQTFQILRPIKDLALLGCQKGLSPADHGERLASFFQSLLSATLDALRINRSKGFATIHIFDDDTLELRLACCTTTPANLKDPLSVHDGCGVVSWVALRRKALVINDLQSSVFNDIRDKHTEFEIVQRQLAVPMFAGDHLVGVLNIEADRDDGFTHQDLYAVSCAAKEAAIAYKFSKHVHRAEVTASRIEALLKIAEHASATDSSQTQILDRVAELLQSWSEADRVEIWLRADEHREFHLAGASYSDFRRDIKNRDSGWSQWVYDRRRPVWLHDIDPEGTDFNPHIWDDAAKVWRAPKESDKAPEDLNGIVQKEQVRCEVGFPIVSHDECLGVVWLKNVNDTELNVAPTQMQELMTLANQTGVVLNAIRASERRKVEKKLDVAIRTIAEENFPTGELNDLPGVEGYLLYKAYEGQIGGDLCLQTSDKSESESWGFLLGDVMGHGYSAALKMLPLMTAFQIHQKESTSTKYVIEQLAQHFAKQETGFGTAICFTCFPHEDGKGHVHRYLTAANAGHPPLIIFRGTENNVLPSRGGVAETVAFGGGANIPFGEETRRIQPGDLIVGYTDGVEEAHPENDTKNLFGTRGIVRTVLDKFDQSPQRIAEGLYDAAVTHARGHIHDDITVLVFRVVDGDAHDGDSNE